METLIQQEYPKLEALYQHLHSHPELSLKEEKTSARIAEELRSAGLEVTTGVGGFGVVGVLKNGSGPTVLVRADMDALPVTEATGLPYASRVRTTDETGSDVKDVGVAHACGHDLHMTSLVGTARVLSETQNEWKGTLVFIAQPAEEKGQGAKAMLDDGLFTRFPRPDYALALHVDSQLPTGAIGYSSGYAFANVDSVDLVIYGRGGHGAYPHLCVDPIPIASELVLALQTIVSRELKPYEPAVVTVGSIHGGTKHNIIPGEVKLELTLRSYTEEVRNQILEAIRRLATEISRAHRAPKDPHLQVTESIPSTYNDPPLVERLLPVFQRLFGKECVVVKEPEMGGEDFGLYGRAGVPSFLFRVGSIPPGRKPLLSLHSPEYAPDLAPTLTTAVRAMVSAVLALLEG